MSFSHCRRLILPHLPYFRRARAHSDQRSSLVHFSYPVCIVRVNACVTGGRRRSAWPAARCRPRCSLTRVPSSRTSLTTWSAGPSCEWFFHHPVRLARAVLPCCFPLHWRFFFLTLLFLAVLFISFFLRIFWVQQLHLVVRAIIQDSFYAYILYFF